MGFTDFSDLFGAVHEAGINLIVNHMMTQRPSLFNYGTQTFVSNPSRMCSPINAHWMVKKRGNPIVTLQQPLPIIGAAGAIGLNYCFQLVQFQVDFHPSNVFTLPTELAPPLDPQQVGLKIRVCGAIDCPERSMSESFGEIIGDTFGTVIHLSGETEVHSGTLPWDPKQTGVVAIHANPTNAPLCFCLDVFATAHMEVTGSGNDRKLGIKLDGLEIVDISPSGLESSLECYLINVLRVGILPRMRVALDTLVFEIGKTIKLSVGATPISGNVPFNPSVDNDQVKVFINVGV